MLELLRIRNLALIADLELEFSEGLNVLTGETGAGKSIILKAIDVLTGEKAEASLVRPGEEGAFVEALFTRGSEEIILRREITPAGRSRAYVNGKLASRESLLELKPELLIQAGQHGQQKLMQTSYQAGLLDSFLPEPELVSRKNLLLGDLQALRAELAALTARRESLLEKRDLLEYQKSEIDKVGPMPGEEDDLLERRRLLKDSEKARQSCQEALELLSPGESGLLDGLARLGRALTQVAEVAPDFAESLASVESLRFELRDLGASLRQMPLNQASDDPEAIEARLYELSQLRRKLKRPLAEILSLAEEIKDNLDFLDSTGLEEKRLAKRERELCKELGQALVSLNQARRAAAGELSGRLEAELKGLGFSSQVKVYFEFSSQEIYPAPENEARLLEDKARILWRPNPGQSAQALDKIASGGELSRFLLALISLRGEENSPTLIFDEVDAGIGGATLNRVGERLCGLAKRQQVILITHWPQLASLAKTHFRVSKIVEQEQTFTLCAELSAAEIEAELARMAGQEA